MRLEDSALLSQPVIQLHSLRPPKGRVAKALLIKRVFFGPLVPKRAATGVYGTSPERKVPPN